MQKTLAQSSKRLIEHKIKSLGVGREFRTFKDRIETPGGGLIIFTGMQDRAVNNSARQNMADLRAAFNDLNWFQYGKGDLGYVPVYLSATQYQISGADVSAAYHVGRRTKAVGPSTGTIYGTISAVAFSTDTIVTVAWDSGSLSNEAFTAVYLAQIPVTGQPVPASAISGILAQNALTGLTLSTAGSSAAFSVAAGQAADSGNAVLMALAASISKTTSAWAVGSGNGALDSGSVANSTWYHVYVIRRPDTGVVDVLISTSGSAPTMPTNYTQKRRIGSMKTDGSAHWVKFSQFGDEFLWDATVEDASSVSPASTSAQTVTLSTPPGVRTKALFSVLVSSSVGSSTNVNLSSLDVSDEAAAGSGAFSLYVGGLSGGATAGCSQSVWTNTSSQIRLRLPDTNTSYWINTRGWIDTRGK